MSVLVFIYIPNKNWAGIGLGLGWEAERDEADVIL
jgi:hypothetical protein